MTTLPGPRRARSGRPASVARERGNEPARGAAVTRSPRSRSLAPAGTRRRRGARVRGTLDGGNLCPGVERAASRAAAPPGRGAEAAPGVPREARQGGQSRTLQAAAEGHRALLRGAAAPVAGQDRGAEPAGRHLADRPRRRTLGEAVPAPARAEEGLLRG